MSTAIPPARVERATLAYLDQAILTVAQTVAPGPSGHLCDLVDTIRAALAWPGYPLASQVQNEQGVWVPRDDARPADTVRG